MKKLFSLGFILMMAISLTACGDNSTSNENPAKKISQEEAMQNVQEKMMEIQEKVENGEMTPEEANSVMTSLNAEMRKNTKSSTETLIESNENFKAFDGMPDWAKDLGAEEPEGLTLDKSNSSIGLENVEKHLGRNVSLQYNGDKEVIKKEAKKIIDKLGIEIFQEADDYIIASGDLAGEKGYSANIAYRTDIDEPVLNFSIMHDYTIAE